jgi:hypothetical protein
MHHSSPIHRSAHGFAPLVVVAAIVVFALFGGFVVILWQKLPKTETPEEVRSKERLAKLAEVRARDARVIDATEARWIDKEKGIVAIPLDRAIDKMVQERAGASPKATDVAVPPPVSATPAPAPVTPPPAAP